MWIMQIESTQHKAFVRRYASTVAAAFARVKQEKTQGIPDSVISDHVYDFTRMYIIFSGLKLKVPVKPESVKSYMLGFNSMPLNRNLRVIHNDIYCWIVRLAANRLGIDI